MCADAATRLSIVVPALDEEATITASLSPLQRLRAAGHEVVVVDGGSADRTLELAAPLADRTLVAPRGRAMQMNAGARLASNDVLLFLHADTRLPEDGVDAIAGALARGHRWGRFDVTLEGNSVALPLVAAPDQSALALHRHRDRRPGDLRHARGVRARGRLRRHYADGRHRAVEDAEARGGASSLSYTTRDHLGTALGRERRARDDPADVAPALRLLARRPPCAARAALRGSTAHDSRAARVRQGRGAGTSEDPPRDRHRRRCRGAPVCPTRRTHARHRGRGARRRRSAKRRAVVRPRPRTQRCFERGAIATASRCMRNAMAISDVACASRCRRASMSARLRC